MWRCKDVELTAHTAQQKAHNQRERRKIRAGITFLCITFQVSERRREHLRALDVYVLANTRWFYVCIRNTFRGPKIASRCYSYFITRASVWCT